MATGPVTQVSDVVVPSVFTDYVQQMTEEKARLVQTGVLGRSEIMDQLLNGGGKTFDVPSFQDLDNDSDNVSTDRAADQFLLADGTISGFGAGVFLDAIPAKIQTSDEVAVRLSRNKSWSSADLTAALAGEDPLSAIVSRVSYYWQRRLQAAFIATVQGVSKDNSTNDSGDYANDIASTGFTDGVTNFSAEAFLDAAVTMGDSQEDLAAVMVHSVVYNRMQKNNLIDFIPDSNGVVNIPTFLGRQVIVDDGVPSGTSALRGDGSGGASGIYETWLFGMGAYQWGIGSPKVPTAIERKEAAGNGAGQEVLYSRQMWALHPVGHAYTGTAANGGPGNGTGSNDLNNAGSWDRVYPERKQIKFARLVTREA